MNCVATLQLLANIINSKIKNQQNKRQFPYLQIEGFFKIAICQQDSKSPKVLF